METDSTKPGKQTEPGETHLFRPLAIRGVTLRNRVGVSPMCQYSAEEGLANDWHLVHLGSRAVGGAALVMAEATAVSPEGRISPGDLGIWEDRHVEPLTRVVQFIEAQGAVAGIQLAHAGRKASCEPPWQGGGRIDPSRPDGWRVVAPSPIPFSAGEPSPDALDERGIEKVVADFEAAAHRALTAGFRIVEVHAAHGYLLHQFLSPLSNRRTDLYGGNLENRMRLLLTIADRLRRLMPEQLPVFVRISATDWAENGWDIEQSVKLAARLKEIGVDLIDVSSGGAVPQAKIPVGPNYQVPFAHQIREQAEIKTAAVGLITKPEQANEIITSGAADLVLLARELLRNPYWPLTAAHRLGHPITWPIQYARAAPRHD